MRIGAVDLRQRNDLEYIIPQLDSARVVYVGEIHDDYAHHLAQLAVIKQLHRRHPDLAIGMEMFQQPYERHLEAFIAGELDEQEMLRRTEWFDRWRYDYRLYKPVLDYAREHGLSVIALNVSTELKKRVSVHDN